MKKTISLVLSVIIAVQSAGFLIGIDNKTILKPQFFSCGKKLKSFRVHFRFNKSRFPAKSFANNSHGISRVEQLAQSSPLNRSLKGMCMNDVCFW